jgi:uncharacterized membrane protein
VVAIVEKQSRFLRFHAFQSLLVHGAAFVLLGGIWLVSMLASFVSGFLGFLISILYFVVGLAPPGLTILLMVKAYGTRSTSSPSWARWPGSGPETGRPGAL